MSCCLSGPCALHLAEGTADYSTLIGPGHVLCCVSNVDRQELVGAFGRAVLLAHTKENQ